MTNFNQNWQFKMSNQETWQDISIPHDWLIKDTANLYKTGIGQYKKTFNSDLQLGQRLFLRFDGVYMDSTLYINGQEAGQWKYGYTAFTHEITPFVNPGQNEILLSVDYQDPNTRWYSGAGVYRDVWLIKKNAAHFAVDGIYVSTKKLGDTWQIEIDTEVEQANEPCEIRHQVKTTCGNPVPTKKITNNILEIQNPQLWDIQNPTCYILESKLISGGKTQDTQHTRFGFREIKFTTHNGFFLNGRRVELYGVCQHHDLGALGSAVSKDALRRQFQILRGMGVNALRTAHNPPAAAFMELADEMGFLVMTELSDMWLRSKTTYDYARFFEEWAGRDVASWVRRDRNSPSIIMWSIGNEIYDTHASFEEGSKTMQWLMDEVRRHDPRVNAPSTLCSNYLPWENTQKCADIIKLIGYNYADYLYEEHHRDNPSWIIYGGETSSTVQSRGIYHFPLAKSLLADDDLQCSSLGNSAVSWGAKSSEATIIAHRDATFALGQFLWTGTDYIGEPTPYHTKNSYFGQVDTAGFPKDSYYIYKSAWTCHKREPFVHVFPYWDHSPGQLVDVRIASNAPRVELFLNGKSLGAKDIDHKNGTTIVADYIVPYEPGVITAVAYDENGNAIAEMERHSFQDAHNLHVKTEHVGELIFAEIYAKDINGNPVENANNRVIVSVKNGDLLGLDNGDSTDYDQYQNTNSRRLFSGKLLAIVKPHSQDVSITAEFDYTDIPIRKIELVQEGYTITAKIHPTNATYSHINWRLADAAGIDSPLGKLEVLTGTQALVKPKGDGEVYVRCTTNNGKDHVSIISLTTLTIEGHGKPFLDPYGFVSGGLYSHSNVPMTNGNDRGVATIRDGESQVGFADLDFGSYGSDEISLWLFPLEKHPFPIDIWLGMPGDAGARKLTTVTYDKGSKWNTYIQVTYKLPERLRGVQTLAFVVGLKVHIKGFQFAQPSKAYQRLSFADHDVIYGDSYVITADSVEGIGNNVTIGFNDMDFETEATQIQIRWRTRQDVSTIKLVFTSREGRETANMLTLPASPEYGNITLPLDAPIAGRGSVSFIFLPGSSIDLEGFRFGSK